MDETYKVIKGVIFRAEFQKKEKFNTCFQIAVEACIKALPRFNPEYGTAFNYLSLTAKRSIIYYLIKRAKKRNLSLDYEYMDDDNLKLENVIRQEERSLRNLEIENLTDTVDNIVDEISEHKSLHNVNKELREYLFYHQGRYDKKDFFRWAKADGISSNLLRKFVKFLKENREKLYKEVGVY
jgi:DNA-directed RNA polymerase specialized sigma subunit